MTPRFLASGFGGMVHTLMLMSEISCELENRVFKLYPGYT